MKVAKYPFLRHHLPGWPLKALLTIKMQMWVDKFAFNGLQGLSHAASAPFLPPPHLPSQPQARLEKSTAARLSQASSLTNAPLPVTSPTLLVVQL